MSTRTPTAPGWRESKVLRRLLLAVTLFGLSSAATCARAGEVSFAIDKANNKMFVTFTGVIEPGDAEKLRNVIETHRYFYLWSNGLVLDSNGGDVIEATKIGNLVERSGWRADVQKGVVCASACFLIYVAAPIRYSEGTIIIHRPYYLMNKATGKDAYQIGEGYRTTISEVKSYLSSHMVPSYLIDLMMSKDSSQGYTLTKQDIVNIGFFSPAVDEYQVQQCHFPTDHIASQTEIAKVNKCREQYLLQARVSFLYGNKYPEAAKALSQIEIYLSDLSVNLSTRSAEYNESILKVQRVVNTLPPDKWISALKGDIDGHAVKH